MEIIILLIIIFLVTNSKKNKQRAAQRAKSGAARPQPMPWGEAAGFRDFAEAMRELAQNASEPATQSVPLEVPEEADPEALREAPKPISRPAPQPTPQRITRSMRAEAAARLKQAVEGGARAPQAVVAPLPEEDEEGCVGGSMAHVHTEGESRAEHAQHQVEIRHREAEEMLLRAEAERRAATGVQALRRAVVMAEVLNRPVALRPRGAGRRAG